MLLQNNHVIYYDPNGYSVENGGCKEGRDSDSYKLQCYMVY